MSRLDGLHDEVAGEALVVFGPSDDADDLERVVGASLDPVSGLPVRDGDQDRAELVPVLVEQPEPEHARKLSVIAEVRRDCERGAHTLWTHASWYEVLTNAEVQAIVSEYGYGPLRSTRTRELVRPDGPAPWQRAESIDLSEEPTDGELRTAVRVLRMGGAVGGSTTWCSACARFLGKLGPDAGDEASAAYKRVARLLEANKAALSGAIPRAIVR